MTGGTTLDDYTDRYAHRVSGMTASEIRALFAVANRPEVVSLAGGMPYISALPLDTVGSMIGELVASQGASALQYGLGQGMPELRERICELMADVGIDVGMGASPDDVVVTVGGQQALDLVARLFLDPGDVVLAEGPTYVGALGVFQAAQAQVVHVPMDEDGLIPAALSDALLEQQRLGKRVKFLYTIPTYQNPAGVTLTDSRREQVLDICERAGLLVIEDDPYGRLSFDGEAPLPLRARRREGVFYLSTFSKTFAPGLRVGWILAPHAVRDKLVMTTEANILCPSNFAQSVITAYLSTMPWREQLKAYQQIYAERRDAMLSALADLMPDGMSWTHPKGGLFVWATLPDGLDAKDMVPRAIAGRVAYVPGNGFYADGTGRQNMRLNFSYPTPERIREGVRRLAGVIEQEAAMRAVFNGEL
ncbi:aminotransferase-like domain-containing protein [Catelliglobosispora koreensis]|uniref:aminotransferase-like domain-containing protein n=1 Tax=Catelliglobosispora koreensis TaxID=129052 RepID=UPI00035EBEE1|nr:aminotransferase class I/II-fold pyridoxal phosphate-dependent enzyme [Catelliglobosispora koreensis]